LILFRFKIMDGSVIRNNELESSDEDSDTELQVALQQGYLKPGLNITVPKSSAVNNKNGLKKKLEELNKNLPWIERMNVTVSRSKAADDAAKSNDFQLEMNFYNQAKESVKSAFSMIDNEPSLAFRPSDYFAEMVKPDDHMTKIREKLLNYQKRKLKPNLNKKITDKKKTVKVKEPNEMMFEQSIDEQSNSGTVRKEKNHRKKQENKKIKTNELKKKKTYNSKKKRKLKIGN
ncbi:putative rRNA-processing protein EBP2 -like protein, partial [Trichinella nativa]